MAQRRLKQNFNEVQAILDAVGQKVDKIEGKGLSANDYTDQDKNKLASVEEDAQENVIEVIESDGVELPIENKTVRIPAHKQSDWSQNDSSGKDYIKNRTHWEENGVVHKLHPKFLDMDASPTSGSTKPVISGGVKEALDGKQDVISDLADIRQGAGLGETAYQKPSAGIPASDLASGVIPDVSGFITRTVNDLANYYLKSETYTKEEVAALIGAIRQFHYEVYAALPATGEGNVLYLIGPIGSGSDKYEEYVYANNGWVKIGDTSIDLSGYVTIEALNQALAGYVTSAALATALTGKVGSETIHNIVELTQAEYDALQTKRGDTMYIITDTEIPSSEVGIAGFEQTTESTEDGGTNIWTVTLTNGQTFQLAVKNGKQGNSGYSGAAGELEVVNNLTDGGATAALSAEQGKVLNENTVQVIPQVITLSGEKQARVNIDVEGAIKGRWVNYKHGYYLYASNNTFTSDNDWNVTDFIPVNPGDVLIWRFGGTSRITSPIGLITFNENKSYGNYWSAITYTDDRTLTVPAGFYYIRVSFHNIYKGNSNRSPISVNGVDYIIYDVIEPAAPLSDEERRWKPLQLGNLLQRGVNSGELAPLDNVYNPYRVTMENILSFPYRGVRLRLRVNYAVVPPGFGVFFWYGGADGTINTSGYSLYNGYEATLPATAASFRVVFTSKKQYSESIPASWFALNVDDVRTWIENGDVRLEYYDASPDDTTGRNKAIEVNVQAARRVLDMANNFNNGMDLLPVFAHISDLHGDATRFENMLDFCDKSGFVDFSFNTGDATLYNHPDGTKWVPHIAGKHTTPVLFCIGNHESWPTGQANLFADNMEDLVDQQGYLKAADTLTDKCYYYKDFPARNIRVIALNYYENGVYDGNLGQTQISWFISTLLSTPAGYGILVTLHSPEDGVEAVAPYDKFMQPSPKWGDTYNPGGFYVGNRPIMQIVDAFISRSTLETSYEDASETVTISADFSGVDATTEFIAYVVGHRHEDNIGYYKDSTNKQLCLGIVCGQALFGDSTNSAWTNQCDLPRGGVGVAQDAFNLYAIDRVGGNIRVVRVGATTTIRFDKRDMMVIPYRD